MKIARTPVLGFLRERSLVPEGTTDTFSRPFGGHPHTYALNGRVPLTGA